MEPLEGNGLGGDQAAHREPNIREELVHDAVELRARGVAWVLREAGVRHELPWRALGKAFRIS